MNYKYEDKLGNIKVFILAGGEGRRLEPLTTILPKPLIPIGDKAILERIMDQFHAYGFDDFIVSLYYKAEMIKLYFNNVEIKKKYGDIQYILETMPLGTIGSLSLAKDMLQNSFFISNSDIIITHNLEKIFEFHKQSKNILTIVGCFKSSEVAYGILHRDDKGNLLDINEKPSYKHLINTGLYIAEPEIIQYLQFNQEKEITELIKDILKDDKKISIYTIEEKEWFDVGQWPEYDKTRKYFEKS